MIILFILFILIIFICIIYFINFKNRNFVNFKEGFWSKDTLNNFMIFSNTKFPMTTFNTDISQKQATEDDVGKLLKTGYWKWSDETKEQYKNAISHNTIIQMLPEQSLDQAMQIYNENAIKQMLYWNTKEGKFVLYGLISDKRDVIRCNNGHVEKTVLNGYNFFNGYKNTVSTPVDDANIPIEIPGFSFTNGVCNPCTSLDNNYSCKFQIDI